MEIIAKGNGTFLIEATEREVKEITRSVTGKTPSDINIGHKLPGLDYASTITKVQQLQDDYRFSNMMDAVRSFNVHVNELSEAVSGAKTIKQD